MATNRGEVTHHIEESLHICGNTRELSPRAIFLDKSPGFLLWGARVFHTFELINW
jgi:hypothetical protein